MLFRTLFNFIFSSPVTIGATVVSVACAGVLVVNVSSYIEATSSSDDDVNVTNHAPASSSGSSSINSQPDSSLPAHQQRNLSSGKSEVAPNKNKNRYADKNQNDNDSSEQYFVDETEGLLTDNDRAPSNNNGPSIFNYSNVGSSNGVTSTNTSTSNSSTSNATSSDDTTTTESNTKTPDPIDEPEDEPTTECNFPGSLEYEIPITADRTDSVSCVPIQANGRPCMCTHTIVDGDDITSWVEDNCGAVEENVNLSCN